MLLRELFVKLGLDVDAQSFAKGQLAVEAVKLAASYLANTISETAAQFEDMVKSIAESTVEIDKSADAIDLNAETLQRYRTAAAEAGVGADSLQQGLAHLREKGKPKDLGVAFLQLADRIAALPDSASQSKLAIEKLGKAGADLLPLLRKGGEEITRLGGASEAFSADQIKAGRELAGAQKTLADMSTRLWRAAIGPLLPLINKLVQRYIAWRKANDEVTRSRITWAVQLLLRTVDALGRAFDATMKVVERFGQSLSFIWKMIYERLIRAFDALKAKAKASLEYISGHLEKIKTFLGEHGLQLVLAGLGVAFTYVGWAGTISGLKTAAAWALAAVKFLAIAAVLAAIYLAFDDIATYEESIRRGGTGKNTMYGKWKGQIDGMVAQFKSFITEWMKPNAEDPWWLKAVKSLIRYLNEAYGIADKLHITNPEDRKYVDPNTLQAKALRAAGVSDPSWVGTNPGMTYRKNEDSIKNVIVGSDSMLADAIRDLFHGRTEFSPASSGAPVLTDNSQTSIVVHAAPGQSTEEISNSVMRRVRDEREDWWNGKMEVAGAATGE